MARIIFCVCNSGEEGYFSETHYFIYEQDAFKKVEYWEAIGDHASLSIYHVNDLVYSNIKNEYHVHIGSADLYFEESQHGSEYMNSDPENATIEVCFGNENDFMKWLTDGKQGGAAKLLQAYQKA